MRINKNNISLRQLRAFHEVARSQSFSAAASTLHVTKSALSEMVKQLETQVGARLLDRTTRKVQLSTIGEEFFEDVGQVLAHLDIAMQRLEDITSVGHGLVRITGAPSVLHGVVIPSLSHARQQYPDIKVVLHEQGADGICQKILKGEVDFGVGALYEEDLLKLECTPLLEDRYVVIAPVEHPLLKKDALNIGDLAGYPYIGLTSDTLIGPMLSGLEKAPPQHTRTASQGLKHDIAQACAGTRSGGIDTDQPVYAFHERTVHRQQPADRTADQTHHTTI